MFPNFDPGGLSRPPQNHETYSRDGYMPTPSFANINPISDFWNTITNAPATGPIGRASSGIPILHGATRLLGAMGDPFPSATQMTKEGLTNPGNPLAGAEHIPMGALEMLAFASGPKKLPKARPGKTMGDVYQDLIAQGKTPEQASDYMRKTFGGKAVQEWSETGADILRVEKPAKIGDVPRPPKAALPPVVKAGDQGSSYEKPKPTRLNRAEIDTIVRGAGFKNIEDAAQAIEQGILGRPENVSKADWSRVRAAIMGEARRDRGLGGGPTADLEATLAESVKRAEIQASTRKAKGQTEDIIPSNMTLDEFRAALEGKSPARETGLPRVMKKEDYLTPKEREFYDKIRTLERGMSPEETARRVGGEQPTLFNEPRGQMPSQGKTLPYRLQTRQTETGLIPEGQANALPELSGSKAPDPINVGGRYHQETLPLGGDGLVNPPAAPPGGGIPRQTINAMGGGGEEVIDASNIVDKAGAFKTVQSSMDVSAVARQALPFLAAHPVTSLKGLKQYALNIQKGYGAKPGQSSHLDKITTEQLKRTLANGGKELYLGRSGGGVVSGEERFQSVKLFSNMRDWPGAFKPLGKAIAEMVERSEAGYIGMLNTVRSETFNNIVEANRRLSDKLLQQGDMAGAKAVKMSQEQIDDLAWVINHASGRGFSTQRGLSGPTVKIGKAQFHPLGKEVMSEGDVQAAAKLANVFIFSPQYRVSRFAFIKDVLDGYQNVLRQSGEMAMGKRRYIDPEEIEKVRLGMGYIAGVSGLLHLISSASGADQSHWMKINPNPLDDDFGFWIDSTHSDFGKVNVGKTGMDKVAPTFLMEQIGIGVHVDDRSQDVMVDVMAGEAQAIRLMARGMHYALNGAGVDLGGRWDAVTHTGRKIDLNDPTALDQSYLEMIHTYIDSGASPGYRLITEAGEDIGQFFEVSLEHPLLQLLQPIWVQGVGEVSGIGNDTQRLEVAPFR